MESNGEGGKQNRRNNVLAGVLRETAGESKSDSPAKYGFIFKSRCSDVSQTEELQNMSPFSSFLQSGFWASLGVADSTCSSRTNNVKNLNRRHSVHYF